MDLILNKFMKIHLMGFGGSGASAVAFFASKMGYEVTGCDLEENTAYSRGIFKGHDPKHLIGEALLVISPAVNYQNSRNPEYLEALKRGMVVTWEEFVGKYLVDGKKLICIAGTHGKSTITAMTGHLLADA
jgi:UDP-N-acetylmuramate--alanine ligase